MKISVVVPVHNAEHCLRGTLDSVLGQTHSDWECVCVDDGSTDGSGAILDEYAAKDNRFSAIHKTNGGEGSARNAGMDVATGELVAFLDSDDRMHPDALRTFCSMWEKTGFDVLRYEARPVADPAAAFEPLEREPACEKVDFSRCGESPFVFCALGWATVITRELSRQMRWTALRQGADMVFVLDCLLRAKSTYRTRARLVNYYMDPNSISRKMSVGLLKGTCDYLPVVMAKADELGVSTEMRDAGESLARELLLRRLLGSWNLLGDADDRRSVEEAFWRTLAAMSARPSFCRGISRAAVSLAARCESLALLRLLVVLPYRLTRRFFR
jgi:glycosyltransferase involved in cell wall biosynthesis